MSDWHAELRILQALQRRSVAIGFAKAAQDEPKEAGRAIGETGGI
jgi:hypothetical protein